MMKFFLTLLFFLTTFFTYSQILINEIMIDGATCDGTCNPNTAEWVELYNTSGSSVDVSCYIICDGDWTYVIPEGTIIPANGFLTIGGAGNEASAPDLSWASANYTGTGGIGTFTNGGEQLALFDNTGTMIDGIIWGGGQGLPDNGNAVTSSGSCTVTSVDLPSSGNSSWVNIGGDGADGSTMARDCDGAATWSNMTGGNMTFGTNNCVPLALDTTKIYKVTVIEEVETKTIMSIHTILGKELYYIDFNKEEVEININNYAEYGILIVRYTDLSVDKINIVK